MTPNRRRRTAVPRRRTRRELFLAFGGAAAVLLVTAIVIWLLRPGAPGVEGTGGLANRQPRAAWLVALTLVALIGFTWWAIRRARDWRGRMIIVLCTGWAILGLASVLAGILWPGGLLRHPTPVPAVNPDDLTSTTLPPELGTTVPGATTLPGTPPTPPPEAFPPTTAPATPTTGGP